MHMLVKHVCVHGIIAAIYSKYLIWYVSLYCSQVTPMQVSLATCSA